MFGQDLLNICENLGWDVNIFSDNVVLKIFKPCFNHCADIEIIVSKEDFIQNIIEIMESYDAEEQAVALCNNSDNTENNDIEYYLEEAEEFGERLEELARTLSEAI